MNINNIDVTFSVSVLNQNNKLVNFSHILLPQIQLEAIISLIVGIVVVSESLKVI